MQHRAGSWAVGQAKVRQAGLGHTGQGGPRSFPGVIPGGAVLASPYDRVMFQPTYPIRTARLTLRPVTLDDLDDVYAYQRRPDVVRWMLGAEPRTREQSRASVLAMAGEDACARRATA